MITFTRSRRNGQPPDYYRALGVSEDASFTEIKEAYWKLAFSDDGRERLQELNEAYEVLGSQERRKVYDAERHLPGGRAGKTGWKQPDGDNP